MCDNEFKGKYGIKCTVIQYYGIVNNIKQNLKNEYTALLNNIKTAEPDQLMSELKINNKVCKFAYDKLRVKTEPVAHQFWDAKNVEYFNLVVEIGNWKEMYMMAVNSSLYSYTRYLPIYS